MNPSPAETIYRALSPAVFTALWVSARLAGGRDEDLACRRGMLPAAGAPLVWLHGASAGELAAATELVRVLRSRGYDFVAGYTAANAAGKELAARRLEPGDRVALAPWDRRPWVDRALDRWRPAALLLIETELWPVLIERASARGIPVVLASARIYPRDTRAYRLVRGLVGRMLRRTAAILAQDDVERQRFLALGAAPEICVAAGNLKHLAGSPPEGAALAEDLGVDAAEAVVVFGSLHFDEIASVLPAIERSLAGGARAIVAPRDGRTSAAILGAARRRGWTAHRRSAIEPGWRLLVLDTIGELAATYALARVAVVCGGFAGHGGHNLREAVAAGAPVAFGSRFEHFAADAAALSAAAPGACTDGGTSLAAVVAEWLRDGALRDRVLEAQRSALDDCGTVAERYLTALAPWFETLRGPMPAERRR
ncbi:MAG: 3-deoxy-D-manno-octulosonic-acid transferase [Candidatus Binatota bacterium]|nr:3-deoxy-D-manno-octulosonic-acid transferase [Candidatus Binatota bacterium]